jgi:hypothetical protein
MNEQLSELNSKMHELSGSDMDKSFTYVNEKMKRLMELVSFLVEKHQKKIAVADDVKQKAEVKEEISQIRKEAYDIIFGGSELLDGKSSFDYDNVDFEQIGIRHILSFSFETGYEDFEEVNLLSDLLDKEIVALINVINTDLGYYPPNLDVLLQ